MGNSKLSIILIIFLIYCCANSSRTMESKASGQYVINLDNVKNNPDDVFLLSSLYKGVKTILLETNESCLIGRMNKIRVFDQYLLILDRHIAKSLYIFDKEGRFLKKIGNVGGGPGEYVEPSDFTIDKDNKIIYVLDGRSNRINKYDLVTGKFINAIKLDANMRSYNIEYIGGKLFADAYFSKHSEDNYLLRIIQEPSGKEENKFLNIAKYNKGISNTSLIQHEVFSLRENGNAVFTQMFMDQIIEIGRDSIFSLIEIKSKDLLSSETIKRAIEKDIYKYMMEIMQLNNYSQISNFIEHRNLIQFNCMKGNALLAVIFNKQTHEVRIVQKKRDDLFLSEYNVNYPIPVSRIGCYDSQGVYYYYDTESIFDIKQLAVNGAFSTNLDRLEDIKKIDEDANPVILYYEFKD